MKILFLVNPFSGRGRARDRAIRGVNRVRTQGHEALELSIPNLNDALHSARLLLKQENFDALIVVGGDGSVHNALPLATEFNIPFAVIPSGTGNDFARVTGVSKLSPEAIVDLVLTGAPQTYDLGRVKHPSGEKIFIQVLSTGFDSKVNERANEYKRLSGKFKYVVATLREIFPYKASQFRFSVDGAMYERKAMLLAVANGPTYGGGMEIVPHANGQDGKLDLLLLNEVPKFEFIKVFPKVFSGKHITHPAVELFSGREISIEADVVAYADGEHIGNLPISITVLPGAVKTWIAR